jgi:hypothetical protein
MLSNFNFLIDEADLPRYQKENISDEITEGSEHIVYPSEQALAKDRRKVWLVRS